MSPTPRHWRPLLLVTGVWTLVASAQPPGPEKIEGFWRDGDQKSLVQVSRNAEGTWDGVIVEAPIAKEVGKKFLRKLVYDPATATFSGLMIKPDDDDDATMNVTVTLLSDRAMKAAVKKWIFSKTLSFVREERPTASSDAGAGPQGPSK